ncbi:hypothetical protein KM043_008902 [Ampulex compressa]|nr:hypothetical protein KM043_008902 [Ampulex compressa]
MDALYRVYRAWAVQRFIRQTGFCTPFHRRVGRVLEAATVRAEGEESAAGGGVWVNPLQCLGVPKRKRISPGFANPRLVCRLQGEPAKMRICPEPFLPDLPAALAPHILRRFRQATPKTRTRLSTTSRSARFVTLKYAQPTRQASWEPLLVALRTTQIGRNSRRRSRVLTPTNVFTKSFPRFRPERGTRRGRLPRFGLVPEFPNIEERAAVCTWNSLTLIQRIGPIAIAESPWLSALQPRAVPFLNWDGSERILRTDASAIIVTLIGATIPRQDSPNAKSCSFCTVLGYPALRVFALDDASREDRRAYERGLFVTFSRTWR